MLSLDGAIDLMLRFPICLPEVHECPNDCGTSVEQNDLRLGYAQHNQVHLHQLEYELAWHPGRWKTRNYTQPQHATLSLIRAHMHISLDTYSSGS